MNQSFFKDVFIEGLVAVFVKASIIYSKHSDCILYNIRITIDHYGLPNTNWKIASFTLAQFTQTNDTIYRNAIFFVSLNGITNLMIIIARFVIK